MISLKHFVASTFTDLSFKKKVMVRGSLLLLGVGLAAKGYSALADSEFGSGEMTWTSVQSGAGYLGGFALGALLRMFFKLSLLVGFGLAVIGFGLSKVGLVELPFESLGDIVGAFAEASKRQMADLQEFLSGFLPASVMSGLGVASGVTQRPDWTPDDE
ncbi:hypothetical protein Poly30_32280 [Planctomycetes bacterium Poly30]|uniref:FUN14 family protein n=1 Tax=Saltatorellus ferox TaxID=2528018 RepID=A0A518EUH7_9BACT|nr:hypothetical protein Poly30_32280 [Planctomycetes bacterium Poly30]